MAEGQIDAQQVAAALRGARRVTAICHENPDADTIGSAIAIALIATRLGAEAEVVSVDGMPGSCAFLPLVDSVRPRPELEPDLAIVCDAATLDRVGRITVEAADWLQRATLVNIDHHRTNTAWGALNLVDPDAAATCQVIAELLPLLGVEPDAEIATALLAGIVRDSQGFSDAATSPRTMRVVARLMEAGASLASVQRHILHELPYPTLALWGQMLGGVDERMGGQIVYTTLLPEMLRQTGTQQHDADGVVEFMARVKGARITLLFRDLPPGATRVSIRTVDGVDAIAIARQFGGGGHARRSGFVVERPTLETRADVLAASERVLRDSIPTS
ncbi:MAG TPA: bifunctional oligoribonuclease/PAP phosphatase NrnA [Candidatus Limnocylindrales bacterium]|nr:bifunctional oligoribonuclease/PAP phosphatase NrnA [Candidatus Limnocylindrales bacterium]